MLNYTRILAPVDFAEISNSVLTHAAEYSEQSQSELVITHVVDREHADNPAVTHDKRTESEAEADKVYRAGLHLEALLDDLEIGYCEKIIRTGLIVPTLLEIVEAQKIDLVVMGTHIGNPASERYKSVTMAMVESARCDVLVLHR